MSDQIEKIIPHTVLELPHYIDVGYVFDALSRRDDDALIEAASRAYSQEKYFDCLKNQVGFTTYTSGKSKGERAALSHYCAMVMVPVLLPTTHHGLLQSGAVDREISTRVVDWLRDWFDNQVQVSIFNAPIGYEEICVWSPSVMREKLEQLACRTPPTVSLPPNFEFYLPSEATRLAFVVAAVQQPVEYPALPPVDPLADTQFCSRLGGALEISGSRGGRVHVLAPALASTAIEQGILKWLMQLHEGHGIDRWDLMQINQDLSMLQLEVGDNPGHTSPIPLRAHQLGIDGVQRVVAYVNSIGRRIRTAAH